jgi:hypothetical protein
MYAVYGGHEVFESFLGKHFFPTRQIKLQKKGVQIRRRGWQHLDRFPEFEKRFLKDLFIDPYLGFSHSSRLG